MEGEAITYPVSIDDREAVELVSVLTVADIKLTTSL